MSICCLAIGSGQHIRDLGGQMKGWWCPQWRHNAWSLGDGHSYVQVGGSRVLRGAVREDHEPPRAPPGLYGQGIRGGSHQQCGSQGHSGRGTS